MVVLAGCSLGIVGWQSWSLIHLQQRTNISGFVANITMEQLLTSRADVTALIDSLTALLFHLLWTVWRLQRGLLLAMVPLSLIAPPLRSTGGGGSFWSSSSFAGWVSWCWGSGWSFVNGWAPKSEVQNWSHIWDHTRKAVNAFIVVVFTHVLACVIILK